MEEYIDIIDGDNQTLGTISKKEAHIQGSPHRVSAVFLRDSNGYYLCPTASAEKSEQGLFHSAAGHVQAGESYSQAAIRELIEECGISTQESDLKSLGSYWFEKDYPDGKLERERFEIFEATYLPHMGPIVFNEEQLDEQWLSKEYLQDIYTNDPTKLSANLKLTLENILLKN